jgi:glycosyltransferase involved in cell wall biosynthesis
MKVSVVIPAFNAAPYLEQAVESACNQAQTAEVIVVDDGSTDNTAELCRAMMLRYPNLVFLQHAGGKNCGAGPSRNLGIRKASNDFIAFLDADDFFLPGRFARTEEVFVEQPDADGVYECLGIFFQTEEAKTIWFRRFRHELTTVSQLIPPEQLIYKMAPLGKMGWFSGDALTVKKSIFEKCGYFSDLRLSQDTELFMKMSITSRLFPGNITTPVAMRRVHDNNRITIDKQFNYKNRMQLWMQMMSWVRSEKLSRKWMWIFSNQYLRASLIVAKLEKNILIKMYLIFISVVRYIFSRSWLYLFFRA